MAHFYADIKGNKGEATRCGTKTSGMRAHARGWNIGGRVDCENTAADNNQVDITLTGGSNGAQSYGFIRAIDGTESGVAITRLDGRLLHRMTEDAWDKLFADEGVAELLKTQLFLHLDKVSS